MGLHGTLSYTLRIAVTILCYDFHHSLALLLLLAGRNTVFNAYHVYTFTCKQELLPRLVFLSHGSNSILWCSPMGDRSISLTTQQGCVCYQGHDDVFV